MPFEWTSWVGFVVALSIAAVVELVFALVSALLIRLLTRDGRRLEVLYRRPRQRLLVITALVLLQLVTITWPHAASRDALRHVLLILSIAAGAWFLAAVVRALTARVVARYDLEVADNRDARRVHTQMAVLRRLAVVVIWLLAAGAAIFTIPGAEAVGTSILASAGLASVVAGIAAQSVLGNVFAGVQLAFSGAIRVDDVVIANGEWGRIEEITLTTVVLKVWDERRLVLPSTYFTTEPFENWTRSSTQLLGTVYLDVDWRISPAAMREKLTEILESTPLWDGRVNGVIVEDATGGFVRMRALVSAANSSDQWDLRCLVREGLVEWISTELREALPIRRVALDEAADSKNGEAIAPAPAR